MWKSNVLQIKSFGLGYIFWKVVQTLFEKVTRSKIMV